MTDHDRPDSDDFDDDDDEEYEVDRVVSREVGAATLRRLADGIATGEVGFTGDDAMTVAVPSQFELEVEYEESDDEAELEVELEWPLVDGEPEVVDASDGADAEDEAAADTADDAAADTEAVDAEALDVEEVVGIAAPASKAQFELYQDRASEWRWRLVHNNGNIIADSGEGYSRKATARKGLESVMRNASGASVVDETE
ncbi:MAG: HVO_2922 family protein [Euryarchaeota archaeon]|nr:HVO_2922 family protein [Euryarchaeota archaeon]